MNEQTGLLHQEALGQSEAFLDFQEQLSRVAPVDRPVLLLGERGTGKELAAGRLHFLSKRWDGPLVTLNCATLSPTLIESELFGYEKGAFTGAEQNRIGRFEAAHGGTLFLDEIGTIPMVAQEKILRVVEYGSFERVGSSKSIEVDVRIVCATNADLIAMANRGDFKRDLLDRLSFEVLFLPPLRERAEDIMILAQHFAARMAYELDYSDHPNFSQKASSALQSYSWPGNVRELKNVIERAVYRAESGKIDQIEFDPFASPFSPLKSSLTPQLPDQSLKTTQKKETDNITDNDRPLPAHPATAPSFKSAVREYEIQLLKSALKKTRYNQKEAASLLGLSYDQFRGLIKKYSNDIKN